MELTNIKTETYHIWHDFYCDIVEDKDSYGAWIYQKRSGNKSFVIGLPKDEDHAKEHLLHYMLNNFIEKAQQYIDETQMVEDLWNEKLSK